MWSKSSLARRLFDYVTDEQVEWVRMDDVYDVAVVDGTKFEFRSGMAQQIRDLTARFPESERAIKAYFVDVDRTAGRYARFISDQIASGWVAHRVVSFFADDSFGEETVDDALERLGVRDPKLRAVLTYLHGDYGATPDEASWVQHCVTTSHYLYGAAYPKGGPSAIAKAVVNVLTNRGGAVYTHAAVESLLLEKGAVTGVRLKGYDIPIRASKVISCVGALNTFQKLFPSESDGLPPLVTQARKDLEAIPNGVAHCMLFCALKGTGADLGLPAANWWINSSEEGDFPSVFISFPSCKDPETWGQSRPHSAVCEVVVEETYANFAKWAGEPAKHRGADYAAAKDALAKRMMDVLVAHFPQLKDKVEFYDASTPLSTEHNINSAGGSSYGLRAVPARYRANRAWLRPATDIPGLYLGGQDVVSCGIVGALMGGACAAAASSGRAMWELSPLLTPPGGESVVASSGPERERVDERDPFEGEDDEADEWF